KIACKAIFYLANCVRMPDNRGFYGFSKGKSHKTYKCNRLQARLSQNFSFGTSSSFKKSIDKDRRREDN
ncbi:MAG: hypothetical protein LBP74_09475, partial [Treponema sp.]|nr:hypothetical protein [Treponema sp.]